MNDLKLNLMISQIHLVYKRNVDYPLTSTKVSINLQDQPCINYGLILFKNHYLYP